MSEQLLPCPTCDTAEHLKVFNCGYSSFNPVGVKCSGCNRKWEHFGDDNEPESRTITWYNANRLSNADHLDILKKEAEWVRRKLGLPVDASASDLYGAMHVMASHAHGYETYIVTNKCDDKQGEIARLTVELEQLRAENVRLQIEHASLHGRLCPQCKAPLNANQQVCSQACYESALSAEESGPQ